MLRRNNHSKAMSSSLRPIVIGASLFVYVALGLYTELQFTSLKPLPDNLLEDFSYYQRALFDALAGQDPYAIRAIGLAFVYPPPALLIIEIFGHIKSLNLLASVFITANLTLLLLMIYGLARHYGYSIDRIWYWFVLCLAFAPFLELLHIGQINVITMFGLFLLFVGETAFPVLAGIGLSLAIITKVTPLFFLGYLAIRWRWRIIAVTLVATGVWIALSALRHGIAPLLTYPDVFLGLLQEFPLHVNSQSFVAKATVANSPYFQSLVAQLPAALQLPVISLASFISTNYRAVHGLLTLYILGMIGLSALATVVDKQDREPLFMVTCLGMMLSPNVMWYHHYVFVLLPVLIWMGWRRLSSPVVVWCFIGLSIIQIDRFVPPYGLAIHFWAHLSLLSIVAWQILSIRRRRRGPVSEAFRQVSPV